MGEHADSNQISGLNQGPWCFEAELKLEEFFLFLAEGIFGRVEEVVTNNNINSPVFAKWYQVHRFWVEGFQVHVQVPVTQAF